MNIELAIVKYRQLPVKTICINSIILVFCIIMKIKNVLDSYHEWSQDEIQRFEDGLQEYGKDFFKITVFKVSQISKTNMIIISEFSVSKSKCSRSNSLLLSMEED